MSRRSGSQPFELEWQGGVAEAHVRRQRPGTMDLPWGTLRVTEHEPALVELARVAWTRLAIAEYRAATAFSALVRSLLEARAPLDLIGMASGFIADEVHHAELAARVLGDLGGAAPIAVDTADLLDPRTPDLMPVQRASEDVVRLSCVREAFSRAMVKTRRTVAMHPLIEAVHERIARDEARHARIGWLYLDWIARELDDAERARLGEVAHAALRELAQAVAKLDPSIPVPPGAHELGWIAPPRFVPAAREAVARDIVAPLARHGIVVRREGLDALLP